MEAYVVETDDGVRWRIQVHTELIEVYRVHGERTLSSAPTARFSRIDQLERWLRERGRGLDDLVET